MAKTKIERINSIEEQIAQLEAEKKKLRQQHKVQENKARTNRLCKRGGLLEKMLPGTIPLTDEQFQTFMEKTMLTPFTRRILDELTAQNAANAPQESAGSARRDNPTNTAVPAETVQQGGTGEGADEGNGARVTG